MSSPTTSLTFNEIDVKGYEKVVEVRAEEAGLHAIIAIHNTRLGPALGGTRIYPYQSFEEALEDALRLSCGMTYKSALSETGTGGGKSVIIADYKKPKSEKMLLAFAEAVESFGGNYICAEDMGVGPEDLKIIRKGTRYIVGIPHEGSSGDPCPYTSWGVYQGIKAVCHQLWRTDSVRGRTFAIQGLGFVGMKLARTLFWEGASLIVTDIEEEACAAAAKEFGATVVAPEDILSVSCDVLVPAARGGILNSDTIPHLQCRAVCGPTNNQLLSDKDDEALFERGILYAPDYLVNAGGLLNVCTEIEEKGYHPTSAREKVDRIYDELLSIFALSSQKNLPTDQVARELVEYKLEHDIGKRIKGPTFHH